MCFQYNKGMLSGSSSNKYGDYCYCRYSDFLIIIIIIILFKFCDIEWQMKPVSIYDSVSDSTAGVFHILSFFNSESEVYLEGKTIRKVNYLLVCPVYKY